MSNRELIQYIRNKKRAKAIRRALREHPEKIQSIFSKINKNSKYWLKDCNHHMHIVIQKRVLKELRLMLAEE